MVVFSLVWSNRQTNAAFFWRDDGIGSNPTTGCAHTEYIQEKAQKYPAIKKHT